MRLTRLFDTQGSLVNFVTNAPLNTIKIYPLLPHLHPPTPLSIFTTFHDNDPAPFITHHTRVPVRYAPDALTFDTQCSLVNFCHERPFEHEQNLLLPPHHPTPTRPLGLVHKLRHACHGRKGKFEKISSVTQSS